MCREQGREAATIGEARVQLGLVGQEELR
jgi:hypothetical protein